MAKKNDRLGSSREKKKNVRPRDKTIAKKRRVEEKEIDTRQQKIKIGKLDDGKETQTLQCLTPEIIIKA